MLRISNRSKYVTRLKNSWTVYLFIISIENLYSIALVRCFLPISTTYVTILFEYDNNFNNNNSYLLNIEMKICFYRTCMKCIFGFNGILYCKSAHNLKSSSNTNSHHQCLIYFLNNWKYKVSVSINMTILEMYRVSYIVTYKYYIRNIKNQRHAQFFQVQFIMLIFVPIFFKLKSFIWTVVMKKLCQNKNWGWKMLKWRVIFRKDMI